MVASGLVDAMVAPSPFFVVSLLGMAERGPAVRGAAGMVLERVSGSVAWEVD
jgi:hypothetical protein